MRQPAHEPNDSTRAGQKACKRVLFRHMGTQSYNRYGVEAIHTRFDAVEWFVFDAEIPDKDNHNLASLIRQDATFAQAIEGLAIFTPEPVPVTVADIAKFPQGDTEKRIAALIDHLDGTSNRIMLEDIYPGYAENGFRTGPSDSASEYLILTDEEATEKTNEDIEESLWAFRASFLLDFMPDGLTEHDLKKVSAAACEDATPIFRALIEAGKGLDAFKVAATDADGRGHFLSTYDGAENKNDDASLFIYQIN